MIVDLLFRKELKMRPLANTNQGKEKNCFVEHAFGFYFDNSLYDTDAVCGCGSSIHLGNLTSAAGEGFIFTTA